MASTSRDQGAAATRATDTAPQVNGLRFLSSVTFRSSAGGWQVRNAKPHCAERYGSMIFLTMADGSPRQVAEAESAQIEGTQVVCRGRDGRVVAIFDGPLVIAYGTPEEMPQDQKARRVKRVSLTR